MTPHPAIGDDELAPELVTVRTIAAEHSVEETPEALRKLAEDGQLKNYELRVLELAGILRGS